jgi:hypothetical protein
LQEVKTRMEKSLRATAAEALLWLATIWWGIWFGGQLFNALMIVPTFSANPPESLTGWYQVRHTNVLDFFLVFNSLWIFLALLVSLLVGWRGHGARRKWVALSAAAALIATAFVLGWMARTIGRLVTPDNGLSAAETVALLRLWVTANWVRLCVEFCGFVFALRALGCARTAAR